MKNAIGTVAAMGCVAMLSAAAAAGEAPRSAVLELGFEGHDRGRFERLAEDRGEVIVAAGAAEISGRTAAEGHQALRLLGGDVAVEFIPPPSDGRLDTLSFAAQRWTRRGAFRLRLEGFRDGGWHEIYNGDAAVKTGDYFPVRIPLSGGAFERYRFVSHSPENAGVLIDQVRLTRAMPMQIAGISSRLEQTPALVGQRFNPLLKIVIDAPGNRDRRRVRRVEFDLSGVERLSDIRRVELRSSGTSGTPPWRDPQAFFERAQPFGETSAANARLTFTGDHLLEDGRNHFWLTVELAPGADIDASLTATCTAVTLDGHERIVPEHSGETPKRLGVALRHAGDDGVASYRIPGIVTTNRGTLIAVYDARHDGWSDLPANIDVGMSRSTDGGRTWEPMKLIMDMGDDPKWKFDGIGDPSILFDPATETVWVAALWSHGDNGFVDSGPGMTPEETGQLVLVRSTDDGKTWSEPINITSQVKDPAWRLVFNGPGRGIAMRNGTLVMPAQFRDADGTPASTIIVSEDHGRTWRIGSAAKPNTTEAQVAEIEPGVLMLNMRDNRGGARAVAVTRDLGATWSVHPSSNAALPDPVCMGSLIAHPEASADGAPLLLFSNPAVSDRPRRNMTIKASRDGGLTWPPSHHVLLDENESAGYSCLTMVDEDTIGILYEGSTSNLVFQRIPLRDVIGGE